MNEDAKIKPESYVVIGDDKRTLTWKFVREVSKCYIYENETHAFFVPKTQAVVKPDGTVVVPEGTLAWVIEHAKMR